MPRCLVGTSGWRYGWNPDGLEWYVAHSGLDAVEVNSTFYRLPPPSMVERWARAGSSIAWAVKIHRRVSHVHRLNEKALRYWRLFRSRLEPLDGVAAFYLLQLPPGFDARRDHVERLRRFAREAGLGWRLAVEYRHPSWWLGGAPGRGLAVEEGFTLARSTPRSPWAQSCGGAAPGPTSGSTAGAAGTATTIAGASSRSWRGCS